MVHRALAASIGADVTSPDILDKNHINNVCKNINFRNRMAQQAQVIAKIIVFLELTVNLILKNCLLQKKNVKNFLIFI
jgi:exoribonuclease R